MNIERLEVSINRILTDRPEADGPSQWDATTRVLVEVVATAPSIHAHLCRAISQVEHLEHFPDHLTIEDIIFEGVLQPHENYLRPDTSRPRLGLELKTGDAQPGDYKDEVHKNC